MRVWTEYLGFELNVVSFREKLIASAGGLCALLVLIFITERTLGLPHSTALVASMGASAVLLFAVPHGQLSQPWPLLAGHGFSALIGVACARWIPLPEAAAACAVGLSIAAMHQFKCIHPPGGATALTAVLGGPAIHALGYHFVWCPVMLNCLVMVAAGVVFNHAFPWRRYPAALARQTPRVAVNSPDHARIVSALRQLDTFVDITEDDLIQLVGLLDGGKKPVRSEQRFLRRKTTGRENPVATAVD